MFYNQPVLVANAAKAVLIQEAPKEGGNAYEAHCLVHYPNDRYDGGNTPRIKRNSRLSSYSRG